MSQDFSSSQNSRQWSDPWPFTITDISDVITSEGAATVATFPVEEGTLTKFVCKLWQGELGALETLLASAEQYLAPGGSKGRSMLLCFRREFDYHWISLVILDGSRSPSPVIIAMIVKNCQGWFCVSSSLLIWLLLFFHDFRGLMAIITFHSLEDDLVRRKACHEIIRNYGRICWNSLKSTLLTWNPWTVVPHGVHVCCFHDLNVGINIFGPTKRPQNLVFLNVFEVLVRFAAKLWQEAPAKWAGAVFGSLLDRERPGVKYSLPTLVYLNDYIK